MIVKITPKDPTRKYYKSNDIIPVRYARTDGFDNFQCVATEELSRATDLDGADLDQAVKHLNRIWGHVAMIETC